MFRMLKNNRGEVNPPADPPADPPVDNWATSLAEEDKGFVDVKGWKQPADVIKGYRELEKYVGYDKIPAPRKSADGGYEKGEMQRVMQALGLPESQDGYKDPEVSLPEGLDLNPDMLKGIKERAHQAGVLPEHYKFFVKELEGIMNTGHKTKTEMEQKAREDAELNLRNKWGLTYDQNAKLVNKLIEEYGQDKADDIMKKYGNDPLIKELIGNIGQDMSEESLERTNMRGTTMTPEAARLEMNKIRQDANHPYFQEAHADHDYWVGRMYELNKMASAGQG